jgi:hypothetical protein
MEQIENVEQMLKINQNGQKYCVRPEEYGGTSREY